jgi:hypothetical protein
LYYCCRLISAQKETEFTKNDYDNIRKVYSIWICTEAPQYARNTINRYCIKEENVVGNYKIDSEKYDLINMILLCLDKDGEDVKNGNSEILKLLRVLLSEYMSTDKRKDILTGDFEIDYKRDFGKDVNVMCNLGEGIRERALNRGREEGIATGIERGIATGIERGINTGRELTQLENLKNLMNNLKITFEEAATALGLSDVDRERLAAKI